MYKINDTEYKLVFLDSNALREIVLNNQGSGKGFIEQFLFSGYMPCFSLFNVIEIERYDDIYKKFEDYFDIVSCMMFYGNPYYFLDKEYQFSLKDEADSVFVDFDIMRTTSPLFKNEELKLKNYLRDYLKANKPHLTKMIAGFDDTATNWNLQRMKLENIRIATNKKIDTQYYLSRELETVRKDLPAFNVDVTRGIDLKRLPGARFLEFNLFRKTQQYKKVVMKNDVLDVVMSCVYPYVDAIIIEAQVAETCKQAKTFIPQIKDLEVFTLKDIRSNKA